MVTLVFCHLLIGCCNVLSWTALEDQPEIGNAPEFDGTGSNRCALLCSHYIIGSQQIFGSHSRYLLLSIKTYMTQDLVTCSTASTLWSLNVTLGTQNGHAPDPFSEAVSSNGT